VALRTSGSLSIAEIASEFFDPAPHRMTEFYGRADGLPDVGPIGIKTFYGKAAPDVPIVENLTFGPSAATNFLLSGGYTTTSWNSGVSTGTWTFAFNDWMTAAENEWKHLVGNTAISIGDSVYFRLNGRQNTGGTTGDVFYVGLVSGSADQNIINTGWTGNTDEQRLGFRLVLSTNLSRSEGAFIFGSTNADGQLIINGALDDNIEIAIQYLKSDEVNEQQTFLLGIKHSASYSTDTFEIASYVYEVFVNSADTSWYPALAAEGTGVTVADVDLGQYELPHPEGGDVYYMTATSQKTTLTRNRYSETSDANVMDTRVANSLGPDYRAADWSEYSSMTEAEFGVMIDTFTSKTGFDSSQTADYTVGNLKLNGSTGPYAPRRYFMSYHNHSLPSYYTAHAHYHNYYMTLGSWYGTNLFTMAISTAYAVLLGGSFYDAPSDTNYTQENYTRRAWNTGSGDTNFGTLGQTTSSGAGSTNTSTMMITGYDGMTGNQRVFLKDLASNFKAISWGSCAAPHFIGKAASTPTACIFAGGWYNPNSLPGEAPNTKTVSYKSYDTATTNVNYGQLLTRGRRANFTTSDYDNIALVGAGDWSNQRLSDTQRIDFTTQSIVNSAGLGEAMYVMQSASNNTTAYITGNYGNSPYTPRNYVKRYDYASGSMNTNYMNLTVSSSGVSISDLNDIVLHGAGTTSNRVWRKLSLSSNTAAVNFGSTDFNSSASGHGPG